MLVNLDGLSLHMLLSSEQHTPFGESLLARGSNLQGIKLQLRAHSSSQKRSTCMSTCSPASGQGVTPIQLGTSYGDAAPVGMKYVRTLAGGLGPHPSGKVWGRVYMPIVCCHQETPTRQQFPPTGQASISMLDSVVNVVFREILR